MSESRDTRLRRLRMRAWRRGTKEMDLVLGPYADAHLGDLAPEALAAFEALLAEDDHELLQWILGQAPPPEQHAALIGDLRAFAGARFGGLRGI